ncbi:MAG: alkene reductase [Brachymonas sp.]|nr:alkene reductase [Brachymonas sp.]
MKLLQKGLFGDISVSNRIFHAPLTRTRADRDNVPGDLMATYYAQRASAGLLLAEATMVSNGTQTWLQQPGVHNAAQVAGWRKVTDAVHAKGGRIMLQIWHPGRATHSAISGAEVVAPTDKAIMGSEIHTPAGKQAYPAPRRLRTDEIPAIVESFRRAFENAKVAGFDGVQVHGANGYLIDEFLRDGANDRSDAYGGSIENRVRFLLEIVDAAIAVWGAGRVGLRISPVVAVNDVTDSDPVALTAYVAQQAAKRGLSHLEIRHGQHDAPQELAVAQAAREHMKQGLVLNGGFTRESGEATLASGLADAIAYGKAFLANPDLPARFERNAVLNAVDMAHLYTTESPQGYIDYPSLAV